MKRPHLLLVNELIKPINNTKKIISEIKSTIDISSPKIVLYGIFSYTVSIFEIMQNEILFYYLDKYPEKIHSEKTQINKEYIGSSSFFIRKNLIQDYVISLNYNSIKIFMKQFFNILSIDNEDENTIDQIIEIKETRNLLLHNNLKVNDVYIKKSGKMCRATQDDVITEKKLLLDYNYTINTVNIIENILLSIENKLIIKYKKFTRHYVFKQIWDYLFKSPVLNFDDYFYSSGEIINLKPNKVSYIKRMVKNGFSSTEVKFLFLIFSHLFPSLSDKIFKPRFLNCYSLDHYSKEKYNYLNSILANYIEIFQN